MADIKWIKLATCMPDDEKMKLIDAMPKRDTIHYVWIRILLLCGKLNTDGEIFLSEGKPLTSKMLAVLFSRPLEDVKMALKVLSNFGMIEIAPDKVIRIVNWDKHQNIEGMEKVREQNRKRAETHREKKKSEKKAANSGFEEIYENEGLEESMTSDKNEELKENNIQDNLDENLNTSDEAVAFGNSNINDVIANAPTTIIKNSIDNLKQIRAEDDKNNGNTIKKTSNVTQNESNVTVTQQNKKEIENKNKKKIKKEKRERDKENRKITEDINNKELPDHQDIKDSDLSGIKNIESNPLVEGESDIDLKAIEIMQYHEKITGRVGGDKYIALREALDIHGEKWVKKAINISLEKNNTTIDYVIGILKNWRREGYPKDDMEVNKNGFRGIGKNNTEDKNKFAGFKPKEPRKLTDAERKRIEKVLI